VIELQLKVSLACEKRTSFGQDYDGYDGDLESLISVILWTLRGAVIPGCKQIIFNDFEKFVPDSGKWRSILTFTIPAYITDLPTKANGNDTRIKEIGYRYN
jgi:hypothetical protein